MIRKATHLAGLAILEGMRSVRPGQYERELDAVGKFVFWRNGAQGDAYYSLIGSGRNAFWPHYNAGKRKMEDGDFLLMDYAPDYGYYESDVTRMFPVNGKFAPWQRELYGFYLACYRAILNAIRPGETPAAIMKEAGAKMDGILASTKFSKDAYRKGAEKFVEDYKTAAGRENAALGHWVGMATHDVGPHTGPLKPGMVFTIEPALTVPEEKTYVRLEDVIFIGDKAAEVVSTDAPWDVDAIEKVMKEEGMLKKYKREIPAN
jgi:Xaa-Pro aminopeptidase